MFQGFYNSKIIQIKHIKLFISLFVSIISISRSSIKSYNNINFLLFILYSEYYYFKAKTIESQNKVDKIMTKLNYKCLLKNYKVKKFQILYFTVYVCYFNVKVNVKKLWQSKCIIIYF